MLVRKLLPAIAVVAVCLSEAALAVDGGRPRHTISQTSRWWRSATPLKSTMRATSWKPRSARTLAAGRDPYADPAAPYKANRLSSPPALPIVNIPSQTTCPHQAGSRRQERHVRRGRLAYNPGCDGWKISGANIRAA
jgi:hypothetical protein